MNAPTHLSLFTGIGGLDLAAEWAGFETVGQCEWADFQTSRLERHWPDVIRWRDIRTLTAESFYERTGLRTVDIISGGFPCQPFSTAGKRGGADDDRYLWPEMLRVITEIRPTWIIGENVAGIVSMAIPGAAVNVESRTIDSNSESDVYRGVLSRQEEMQLYRIAQDLEGAGFDIEIFFIPACAVGAPHRRMRIFIVGYSEHNGQLACSKLCRSETSGTNSTSGAESSGESTGADRPNCVSGLRGYEGGSESGFVANPDNKGFQIAGHESGFKTLFTSNGAEHESGTVPDPDYTRLERHDKYGAAVTAESYQSNTRTESSDDAGSDIPDHPNSWGGVQRGEAGSSAG